MKTVFTVTQRDIKRAPATGVCPVNAAMSRQSEALVVVGHRFATIGRRRFLLPASVTERIVRWDKSGTMTPFRFSIDIGGAR